MLAVISSQKSGLSWIARRIQNHLPADGTRAGRVLVMILRRERLPCLGDDLSSTNDTVIDS